MEGESKFANMNPYKKLLGTPVIVFLYSNFVNSVRNLAHFKVGCCF